MNIHDVPRFSVAQIGENPCITGTTTGQAKFAVLWHAVAHCRMLQAVGGRGGHLCKTTMASNTHALLIPQYIPNHLQKLKTLEIFHSSADLILLLSCFRFSCILLAYMIAKWVGEHCELNMCQAIVAGGGGVSFPWFFTFRCRL